jgi:hypothetical protein
VKFQQRNHKRDLEIVHLRDNLKWTFTAIAKKYDITKARARVLYNRVMKEREQETNKNMGIGA